MEASWQPDPTGRHQYRWWDGAGWTDSVADDGQTSVDPVEASSAPATVFAGAPPQQPFGSPPIGETPVALPDYSGSEPAPAKKKGGIGKWIAIGAVVVIALGVGGFLLLGGDDGGGSSSATGRFTTELTDDKRIVTKEIELKQGEAVRIRVEPPSNMDTRSGYLISRTDARADASAAIDNFETYFSDSSVNEALSDLYSDAESLFSDDLTDEELRRGFGSILDEDGGRGEPDAGGILALSDSTYILVIGSYDEDENGTVVVYIEKWDGDPITDPESLSDFVSDPFYTDTDFYTDSEPYSPGS